MLRARHNERADVRRISYIDAAQRISQAERLPAFPYLQGCGDMENLGAGIRSRAAIENALNSPADRVSLLSVREREIVSRVEVVDLIAPGASGLSETQVQRHEPTADVWVGPLEYEPAAFVLVEA